jgi:mediator of RNA polymerase II transcription subunit 6
MPEAAKSGPAAVSRASDPQADETALERVAEEAFMVHMRYGGEYIDKNPITGRPGEFHLSSTGRKPIPPLHADPKNATGGLGAMNGPSAINTKVDDKKDGKADKTPKSATMPKLKKRKSKVSGNTPAAS